MRLSFYNLDCDEILDAFEALMTNAFEGNDEYLAKKVEEFFQMIAANMENYFLCGDVLSVADFCAASVYMCVINGKFGVDLKALLIKNTTLIPYWVLLDEMLEGNYEKEEDDQRFEDAFPEIFAEF